jgi:hypothetical protein
MMRMQPDSEFSGLPVPASAAPIAIELSEASVTFGRGARAVPALATTTLRIALRDVVREWLGHLTIRQGAIVSFHLASPRTEMHFIDR